MDEKAEPKKEPVEPKASSTTEATSASTSSQSASGSNPSAAAAPKRSFMPNIAVQRVKKEVKEEESKSSQSGRKPPQPNLSRSRGGGRGGGRGGANQAANLIQSHSIFEAGPGQSVKRYGGDKEYYESTTRISGLGSGGGGGGSSSISVIKRESNNNDQQRSLRIEENLLIEDVKEEDEENSAYVSIKYEKKEPPMEEDIEKVEQSNLDASSRPVERSALRNIFDPLDINEERDKLLLFQIPETLGLGEMGEGHIGKLRIRKSGKIELCINDNIILGVSLSVAGSFLQDATVLELNDEQNSGKLTNLGHIENKIVTYQKI